MRLVAVSRSQSQHAAVIATRRSSTTTSRSEAEAPHRHRARRAADGGHAGNPRAKIASDDVIAQAGVAVASQPICMLASDDYETTALSAATSAIQPAVHMIENCLGALPLVGRFSLDVARSGRVTTAIVPRCRLSRPLRPGRSGGR